MKLQLEQMFAFAIVANLDICQVIDDNTQNLDVSAVTKQEAQNILKNIQTDLIKLY